MKRLSIIPRLTAALLVVTSIACDGSAWIARWDRYIEAATKARERRDYDEAEKQLTSALREAEQFGREDVRLPTTLGNLGILSYAAETFSNQNRITGVPWNFVKRRWALNTRTWPQISISLVGSP